jgi:Cu(I)/Ag(I) efflux system membrane fusion protein
MMNPEGDRVATTHHHAGTASPTQAGKPAAAHAFEGVPAAFRQQLEEFLLLYFQVAEGLSHDDLGQSLEAAKRMPEALRVPDAQLLTGMAHDMWQSMKDDVIDVAEEFGRAPDMDQARNAFYRLSERTIHLVRLMGASGSTDIFVYHCPMARGGAGADWLQPSDGVENPYYGSQMFRCGERTETLVESSTPAADTSGQPDSGSGKDHEE